MQIRTIKQKMLKEGALAVALLAVLGGMTYFFDDYHNSYMSEVQQMKNSVDKITLETRNLREKFTKVQKNADLYAEYTRQSADDGLSLSRALVAKKFEEFRYKYFIGDDTKIVVSKPEPLKDAKYNRPTTQVLSSTVSVNFDAMTDEDIYAFVQALGNELPGIAKFRSFSIKQDAKITDEVVKNITRTGKQKLVSGTIDFTLYGIQPIVKEAPPTNAAP